MEDRQAPTPFTGLWFKKDTEEKIFSDSYIESRFKPADRRRLNIVSFVATTFAVGRLSEDFRDGALTIRGVSSTFFAGVYLWLSWLWSFWNVDSRPQLRTVMVLITRVVVGHLPIALFSQVWFSEQLSTARSVFRFLTMNTGVLGLVFHSFAQPLLTWQHLLVQVPTVIFMALYTPQTACGETTITAESAPYLMAVWKKFNLIWTWSEQSMNTPTVQECCQSVVVMTQVAGGLFLPSYILWASEYFARFEYNPRVLRELKRADIWVHVMLFFPFMSCLWVLLHLGSAWP